MRITWRSLHDIGTSKIVNTSFIWLALIPFFARVLDELHAAGAQVPRLPLNFVTFYYSAFCFAVASLVFNLFCPTVIKLAPTFGAFKAGGYSLLELKNWFHDMVPACEENRPERSADLIRQFLSLLKGNVNLSSGFASDLLVGMAGGKMLSEFWGQQPTVEGDSQLALVHDFTVTEAEKRHPKLRNVAAVFYGLGFFLFGVVAVLNLIVVCKESYLTLYHLF